MLPKINRLSDDESIEKVKKIGRFYYAKDLSISVLEKSETTPTRFGFVVSTKVSPRAVDRNRIKRVLRNLVRSYLPDVRCGFEILFLVKGGILKVSQTEIKSQVFDLFKRARCFTK